MSEDKGGAGTFQPSVWARDHLARLAEIPGPRIIQAAGSFAAAGGMSGDAWPGPQAMFDYFDEQIRKAKGGAKRKANRDELRAAVVDRARADPEMAYQAGADLIEAMAPGAYEPTYALKLAGQWIREAKHRDI